MRKKSLAVATAFGWSVLGMVSTSHAQPPGSDQTETAQERKNITVVQGFWREVHQEFQGNAVSKYLAEEYVEHNNGGVNGSARMAQFFGHPPPVARRMKTVSQTVYARGQYVLLHQHRVVPDPSQPGKTRDIDMIEMLRVYDGLLQEHWMFFPEGYTPANQPQTEQEYKNIGVVKGAWRELWQERDANSVPEYIADGYIERGAGVANGKAAMVQRLEGPLASGAAPVKVVSQTVYARGSFVLLHQQRVIPDPSQPGRTRQIDLIEMFQIYDGLIQEHLVVFPWEHGISPAWGE